MLGTRHIGHFWVWFRFYMVLEVFNNLGCALLHLVYSVKSYLLHVSDPSPFTRCCRSAYPVLLPPYILLNSEYKASNGCRTINWKIMNQIEGTWIIYCLIVYKYSGYSGIATLSFSKALIKLIQHRQSKWGNLYSLTVWNLWFFVKPRIYTPAWV